MRSPSSSRYRRTGSVTISDKARDYLMKHGNAVHIFTTRSGLSWGRVNLGPSVRRGVPKNAAEYDMVIVNQIRLYLHRDFDTPFPLVIDVHDLLGLRMLYISGWKLV
jgi:hypothetical protein